MDKLDFHRRFGSLARLYGPDALETLQGSSILVAGLGGVGSWAAEALARTAVGHLILVDLDHIAESNINRQVHALSSTVGQAKIEAMAHRLRDINAHIDLTLIDDFIEPDNAQTIFTQTRPGLVLDCTDHVSAKISMLQAARQENLPFLMCGGAGGKTNSLVLRQSDLADVHHDALLGKIRYLLRKHHGYPKGSTDKARRTPKMRVNCLWLDQKAVLPWGDADHNGRPAPQGLNCAGYGSAAAVTAGMGLQAANWAVNTLLELPTA